MIAALIIFLALVTVGTALYIHELSYRRTHPRSDAEPQSATPLPATPPSEAADEECCGQHSVCERDSLLTAVDPTIHYYNDEELDRFRGREPADYSAVEVEEFRDVLLTLRAEEVAPWGRSMQLRGISLPHEVREEFLLLIADLRRHS